ncbi:MAG: C40 family peptidase [Acidobacteria bacterium]|nr:C40 family peptidase [Acidobacteriota bacterium]
MRTGILLVLLALAAGACASRSGVPRPFPGAALPPGAGGTPAERAGRPDNQPIEAPAAAPEAPGALADVIQTALGFLGAPYRNGGSDPSSGFDCSGFMQWVFSRHGTALPREVHDQFHAGSRIDLKDVQPGDLIFFETVSRGASHVGMVIGDGRFVHAPSSKGVVRVEPYTANYWIRRFVGARRLTEAVNASPVPSVFPGSVRNTK